MKSHKSCYLAHSRSERYSARKYAGITISRSKVSDDLTTIFLEYLSVCLREFHLIVQ